MSHLHTLDIEVSRLYGGGALPDLRLVQLRPDAEVDSAGRLVLYETELQTLHDYRRNFHQLTQAGYSWINLWRADRLGSGAELIVVELPREPTGASKTAINLSGPSGTLAGPGGDESRQVVFRPSIEAMDQSERLSARRFNTLTNRLLGEAGWTPVPLPERGGGRSFYRRVEELVFMLNVQTSTSLAENYTANLYLGQSFSLARCPADLGEIACRRIGRFLTAGEAIRCWLPAVGPGHIDRWWEYRSVNTAGGLVEAVQLCAPRFLEQDGLIDRVRSCEEFVARVQALGRICAFVEAGKGVDPPKGTRLDKRIPSTWYHAAALETSRTDSIMNNRHGVKRLAEDAWNCHTALWGDG